MIPSRKCRNCGELGKDCTKFSQAKCELKTMMIEQLVEPHKIGALVETLSGLGLQFTPVGKTDFILEPCDP